MRKAFLGLLFVVVLAVSYLIYAELSFSPLDKDDFQKLFLGNRMSFNKSCSKNFLGVSAHGEYFEIYKYTTENVIIDKNYPRFIKWENNEINSKTIVSKWKSCPLDSQALKLYRFTLTVNDFDKIKCCSSFNREILNPNNYYSYIYFNELDEEYFLLYCKDSQELYYIRRKGF